MCCINNYSKIKQRQAAVTELNRSEHPSLSLLKASLQKLPDLEKKLCSAYHKKVQIVLKGLSVLYLNGFYEF